LLAASERDRDVYQDMDDGPSPNVGGPGEVIEAPAEPLIRTEPGPMTNLPTQPDQPAPDPAAHPWWCDPAQCTWDDPLGGEHRSTPATVDPPGPGDVKITAQLSATVDEPIETAPTSILLTLDASFALADVRQYSLDAAQVFTLSRILRSLAETLAAAEATREAHGGGERRDG